MATDTGRPPSTPWAIYIRDRVSEGPQLRRALMAEAAKLIPPGRKFRRGLSNINNVRRHRGAPELHPSDLSQEQVDQLIRAGGNNIISVVLTTMTRSKRIATIEGTEGDYVVLGDQPWT